MENVKRLSDIEAKPVWRLNTGFDELDYIYGYSLFSDRTLWGMPVGKISLWSGISGIGKSRLCIEVAKRQARFNTNPPYKILYFQTESTLEDFAGWAKDTTNYSNFYCSGESSIDEIIKTIYTVSPNIVFIDSVNEIDEFENGNKHETRRLIKGILDENGNVIKPGLKQVCNDLGCHIILLGQLNQDRKTIKGGTSLPHLVDIALDITENPEKVDNSFMVKVGIKHRYGEKNSYTNTIFFHTNDGVINNQQNRLCSKMWCDTHDIVYEKRYEGCTPGKWAIPGPDMDRKVAESQARNPYIATTICEQMEGNSLLSRLNKKVGDFFGLS